MSDNLDLKLNVEVPDTGEEIFDALTAKLAKLESKLKAITAGMRSAAGVG